MEKKVQLSLLAIVLAILWLCSLCVAGEIEVPYKGLGDFVAKDGTLDQQGCWKEVERQNQACYEKCRKEIEPEFSWKKCSIYSAVFFAIKENYWDKRED